VSGPVPRQQARIGLVGSGFIARCHVHGYPRRNSEGGWKLPCDSLRDPATRRINSGEMDMHAKASSAQDVRACGCHRHIDAARREPAHNLSAPIRTLSRRGLLRGTIGSAAAGFMAGALELAKPDLAQAQSSLSPQAALQALMEGNQRFTERRLSLFQEDLAILRQNTSEKQEPFSCVLSCADSRVPVELIFDQSIGHVFVNRVAGNIATPEIIASIEYGAAVLGAKVVMVLGHGACGAVKATMAAKAVPGQISALYQYIRPAVNEGGTNLEASIKANARIQARLLKESSPVLAGLLKEGKLEVVGAYYDIASGKVALLD
jgi:carbonic anhydrase